MNNIKVRFAPSPTGTLHLGGARTALFNYLFAKSQNGVFCLRIDDTDPVRSDESYTRNIINSLNWLGITWTGDIVYQSKRKDIYLAVVDRLLAAGHAYKSYTTPEAEAQLSAINDVTQKKHMLRSMPERPGEAYAVRFKAPLEGSFELHDQNIKNMLHVNYNEVDDFVLLRQDDLPTYMLASVIDDHEMQITHIIRGMEHMPNTKRQIPLMKALGYSIPTYVHIPLINNENGTKLSKREGAKSVHEYQQWGILPEALINYMCLLGWGHPDSQEIMSMSEAIHKFEIHDLRQSPSRFDMNKLLSINKHYIQTMSNDSLMHHIKMLEPKISDRLNKCLDNMKTKADTLQYIIGMSQSIFDVPLPQIQDALPELSMYEQKFIQELNFQKLNFQNIDVIKDSIMTSINDAQEVYGKDNIDRKNILMYIRIALTGMRTSPGLFEIMYALGAEICNSRLNACCSAFCDKP